MTHPPDQISSKAPSVAIRIERVILDGFDLPPGGRTAALQGMEKELARLFEGQSLQDGVLTGQTVQRLRSPLLIEPGLPPALLGEQIAQAVYQALIASRKSGGFR